MTHTEAVTELKFLIRESFNIEANDLSDECRDAVDSILWIVYNRVMRDIDQVVNVMEKDDELHG